MPEPRDGTLDQAVARLLKEPESDSATPEVEPDAQHEAPDEAVDQVEDEDHEESETDEIEEEDDSSEEQESEDAEDESEYEEETEDEDQDTKGEEPVYTVKIDGEEYEVPLSELTSGYQRQKDYTKKTQAVAEERKQLESKLSEITAVQEDFHTRATLANELLNRDLAKYASVDWEKLKAEDPQAFLTKQIEIQDVKRQQAELQQAYRASQEQAAKAQQEALNAKLAEEKPKVLAAFPEWIDNDKANKHWSTLMDYGRSIGFSDNELANAVTARDLTLLEKARKYDEIQKVKKGITKKAKPAAKKVVKPKGIAPKSTGAKKRLSQKKDNLRASGSINDAAQLILERRLAGQKRFTK